MVVEFNLGDVVRLKKPHPCGSYEWEVVRLGADVGLKCLKCRHQIMLERVILERRLKGFVSRGPRAISTRAPALISGSRMMSASLKRRLKFTGLA